MEDAMIEPPHTPKKAIKKAVDRRSLLLGSCAAVGAAIPSASAKVEQPDAAAGGREPEFRETEHVRAFYERSRF